MRSYFQVLPQDTIESIAARYDSDYLLQHALTELLHRRAREQQLLDKNAESLAVARADRGVLTLQWLRVGEHTLPLPCRAHDDDAGIDLPVIVTEENANIFLRSIDVCEDLVDGHRAGGTIMFRSGWAVAIPVGWYGQIVVRSSAGKAGWDIESSGVIDAGYRGEIMIPLVYRGDAFSQARLVRHGDRLVQMLLLPVPRIESEEVAELLPTTRGAAGFGSSGKGVKR